SIVVTLAGRDLVEAVKASTLGLSSIAEVITASVTKVLRIDRAEHEHAAAIAELDGATTPQAARALQVTENAYRRIGEEFGYLSSSDVAERMHAKSGNRQLANSLRREGKLLGVRRTNRYLYPGFQFDDQGQLKPGMG